jgi:hypothetical protein
MNKSLKVIISSLGGLLLITLLAVQAYQALIPEAVASPVINSPYIAKAKSQPTQTLGLATTNPTSSPNLISNSGVVSVSSVSIQPANAVANDTQIDPPPPVVCHIYDACGVQPADEQQGIYGTITIGPTTPVCRIDLPCDRPYSTTIVVSNSEGEVTRFISDKEGHFNVALLPGTYRLSPVGSDRLPWMSPQSVTVTAGLYTQVDIQFDSGIR